jgi:hypothetical protein
MLKSFRHLELTLILINNEVGDIILEGSVNAISNIVGLDLLKSCFTKTLAMVVNLMDVISFEI